nr:hypothetical protein [Wolbachia endosymbiont (group B) of Endotricha flammealis]
MIAENNIEDIEIAIDSTGISIYNTHSKENSTDRVAMSKRENCT